MLSLLPLEQPDQCNCCSDPLLLRWHGIARKMDLPVSLEVMRDDEIVDEAGEDAFLDDELAIAAALSAVYAAAVAKVKPLFLRLFDKTYSPSNLQSALDEADPIMSNIYDQAKPEVERSIRSSLLIGIAQHGGEVTGSNSAPNTLPIMQTPSARQFETAIINATRYSTNRFFNTQIVPGIIRAIDNAFHQLDAPDLAALQAQIATHFRTVPYWHLIANVAASRGYHYGMLRTLQSRGIIAYRFTAILDARTSKVCRAMNGKEFLVGDAINTLDALAEDPDPMAAKNRTPWVKPEAVEGKTSRDLASMGVLIPPLHPRCRSTITPIYG